MQHEERRKQSLGKKISTSYTPQEESKPPMKTSQGTQMLTTHQSKSKLQNVISKKIKLGASSQAGISLWNKKLMQENLLIQLQAPLFQVMNSNLS